MITNMTNPFLRLNLISARFFIIATFLFIYSEPIIGDIWIINVIYFLSI